jgi:hypothetical protein
VNAALSEPVGALTSPADIIALERARPVVTTVELGSPFTPTVEDGVPLDDLLATQPRSLLRELLSDPRALAERLLDGRAARTMVDTTMTLGVSSALGGAALGSATHGSATTSMLLLPAAMVLAVIAALGPVAASAVMVGARLPWRLLAGTLTMSATRGALVLCASAPLSVVGMRADAEWLGPLLIVFSFALAGLSAGRLLRQLLAQAALVAGERSGASLGEERLVRVDVVGRVGLVQLAFTMTIAVWSLRILG